MFIKEFLQHNTAMFKEDREQYMYKIIHDWIPLGIDTAKRMEGGSKEYAIKVGDEVYTVQVNKSKELGYPVDSDYENTEGKKYVYAFITKGDSKDCGALVINTDKKTAYISIIYNLEGCVTQNGIYVKDKIGTKMLQIMIEWCKLRGMKEVFLHDESRYYCKSKNFPVPINILQAHTMTHGYPWYWNFGFRYISEENNHIVAKNAAQYNRLLTRNVHKSDLMRVIRKELKDNLVYSDTVMTDIERLYDHHMEDRFGEFVKGFQYSHCDAFSYVYQLLYMACGYKRILTPRMVLAL
jgi:hypothetical protein